MKAIEYKVVEKIITLYMAGNNDAPLIVLNSFSGNGEGVWEEVKELSDKDFSLLNISNLKWNHDMTPWYSPPLPWEKEESSGGADEYLERLIGDIIPKAKEYLEAEPSKIGIAGYSLGGLFALYALYKCDMFDCGASVSGSLWFPGFKDFVFDNNMKRKPEKLYISLGDKEAKTKNQILRTVQENSEAIAGHYREQGLDVTWELNPGNHFREPELRTAKGIAAILK
jgi:predicted alpha/beta superfamily hydrolase